MAQFEKHFVQDLTQDIKIRQCGTIVFNGDNLSNVITVDLYNGTEPYSGGGSVSCSVICPDGATVPITNGSISGNTVTVTLTGDCFAIPGQIGVGVQVVSGDIRTTILKAIYNVELLETDTIVDPGSKITASVGQLVSDIENAVAQIPASDMASLMAGIAPTFSASTNYTAGAYVYYNGTLYRFTTAHAAGSWTGTDATAVVLGNDVADLKSAFSNDELAVTVPGGWEQNRVMSSGGVLTEVENNSFCHSAFLSVGSNATISVATGYKIFAWESAYNELGHAATDVTSGWADGIVNYTYHSNKPYLMICVMKSPSAEISPAEASYNVNIYYTTETAFALKTTVNAISSDLQSLETDVRSAETDINTLETNLQTTNNLLAPVVLKTNALLLSDEISFTYTPTPNTYISALTGRIVSTQSDFTSTSNIKVNAGTVAYIPNVTAGDAVALLARAEVSPTPLYTTLAFASGLTENGNYYLIDTDCEIAFSGPTSFIPGCKLYKSPLADTGVNATKSYVENHTVYPVPSAGQIAYIGDTKSESGYICNAVAYKDGVIIAARSNGKVVRIGYDGTEETLLSLTGTNMDWRCVYMDANENVYVSPHASLGSMQMTDRGLYKLTKGANAFVKVLSLYNPSSSVPSETQSNDDTIWTMCEDNQYLYAGVYAHTVRANPTIYRSSNGDVWHPIINFNTAGLTTDGMHIHSVIYSKWQKAIYCIVGEINTIFKSTDAGANWTNLNITLRVKGSAMLATEHGIFIGSDGERYCEIDWLHNDDYTHETVFSGWANTVFAIRRSDVTGLFYAFTKVDSSVNAKNSAGYDYKYPPTSVFSASDVWEAIAEWKTHISQGQYDDWYQYYQDTVDDFPDDAIRPRHAAILVSRDGGKNWDVLTAFDLGVNPNGNNYIDGFWTTGYFRNGECLTGKVSNTTIVKPIIISEGKHKYITGGCDLSGEIFVRTNSSNTVEVL